MSTEATVILRTHNPQMAFLGRVLEALRRQTLPPDRWELLLVDNASDTPVSGRVDLSWHPLSRIVPEPRLGSTWACIRGIEDASGEVLVFVDDDNVLCLDYLEKALEIGRSHPFLGAWGGAVTGEFEGEPPGWSRPYLGYLALRDPPGDRWGNSPEITECLPCGAGLCIRSEVARTWARRSTEDPRRLSLGRIGKGLGSGEDADMVFTSCDLGLGMGVFPSIRLTHIIPARRLSIEYFERLVRDMHRSTVVLEHLRKPGVSPPPNGFMTRLFRLYSRWRMPAPTRRLMRAADRGTREGYEAVRRAALPKTA
jgi:hypothetical protein